MPGLVRSLETLYCTPGIVSVDHLKRTMVFYNLSTIHRIKQGPIMHGPRLETNGSTEDILL